MNLANFIYKLYKTLSSIPPWPGNIEPESFASAALFIKDSNKSPKTDAIDPKNDIIKKCFVGISGIKSYPCPLNRLIENDDITLI